MGHPIYNVWRSLKKLFLENFSEIFVYRYYQKNEPIWTSRSDGDNVQTNRQEKYINRSPVNWHNTCSGRSVIHIGFLPVFWIHPFPPACSTFLVLATKILLVLLIFTVRYMHSHLHKTINKYNSFVYMKNSGIWCSDGEKNKIKFFYLKKTEVRTQCRL